ncbi:MAG: fumarylacetoacetate hydrolase family protein [Paludibacteraceae bacterium]
MGFTYLSGISADEQSGNRLDEQEFLLKGDSALLVNKKPFFVPEKTLCLAAHPCVVMRISKLGKNISPRFAYRYIDAIAAGLHIEDEGMLALARKEGHSWTAAIAADGSLPVGAFLPLSEDGYECNFRFFLEGEEKHIRLAELPIAEAVAAVSRVMTIRQGDMLFLTTRQAPFYPKMEQFITATIESGATTQEYAEAARENLYCKIK